jgi:hypothetical protein
MTITEGHCAAYVVIEMDESKPLSHYALLQCAISTLIFREFLSDTASCKHANSIQNDGRRIQFSITLLTATSIKQLTTTFLVTKSSVCRFSVYRQLRCVYLFRGGQSLVILEVDVRTCKRILRTHNKIFRHNIYASSK